MCVVIRIFIMPYEKLFKERQSGNVKRIPVHIRWNSHGYIRTRDGWQNNTCISISNTHVILSGMHISRSLLNMGNTVKAQPGIKGGNLWFHQPCIRRASFSMVAWRRKQRAWNKCTNSVSISVHRNLHSQREGKEGGVITRKSNEQSKFVIKDVPLA